MTEGFRDVLGVDSVFLISETRDFTLLRGCFFSRSTFSPLLVRSAFSTEVGLSWTMTGDVGRGLEPGSALERMWLKDMTPAERLGVLAGLDGCAEDSVRARAGSTVVAAPLACEPGMGAGLELGDGMLRVPADGLTDPRADAG